MPSQQQQIAELGTRITELEDKFAKVSGDLAELNQIMLPFMGRYRQMISPYYDELVAAQRDVADMRVAMGDRAASGAADARSPLDRFFEDPTVQEQFERSWQGKKTARPTGPLNLNVATPDLRKLYRQITVRLHPMLTDSPKERERRRQLFIKVDEAFVQRNEPALQAMTDSYDERSYLPAVTSGADPVPELQDRVVILESALSKLEGQYYDVRYGPMARLKAYAEQAWAEQKRDLLTELSQEIQAYLREANAELRILKAQK